MEQLQQQQQIQRALKEKLLSMQQQNMDIPTQASTGHHVSTKGSCSAADPLSVVAIGRQLQGGRLSMVFLYRPNMRV